MVIRYFRWLLDFACRIGGHDWEYMRLRCRRCERTAEEIRRIEYERFMRRLSPVHQQIDRAIRGEENG